MRWLGRWLVFGAVGLVVLIGAGTWRQSNLANASDEDAVVKTATKTNTAPTGTTSTQKNLVAAELPSIPDFRLQDFRGRWHALADLPKDSIVVVAFLGTECPLVKLYARRLQALADEFQSQNVHFVGINSNTQDTLTELATFARKQEVRFPLLKDPDATVADLFQAERTPEVFILDANRQIRYQGRIDKQYTPGVNRQQSGRQDLKLALQELLAGQPVSVPITKAAGCLIGRPLQSRTASTSSSPVPSTDPAMPTVTYANQIARILQKRCIECHRAGQIGPFALTDYEEVVGWGDMIVEVLKERRMPPWHANPDYGHFSNSTQMPEAERQLLYEWVETGMALGDVAQLPTPEDHPDGWRIPEPDLVLYMGEHANGRVLTPIPKSGFPVAAEGEINYQYFTVDRQRTADGTEVVFEFTEDKWVQYAEARPGNFEVVHHILVEMKTPTGQDRPSEWLTAYAPGARPLELPVGMAKRIPKGTKLVFQMHYTPNGRATTDRSMVALKFVEPGTVQQEVFTRKSATNKFRIPPKTKNFIVEADHKFAKRSQILAMFPHMHIRGAAFRYETILPNGKREIILDIPAYDFNWQNSYHFAKPLEVPAGTKLHCTAVYDNSEHNPYLTATGDYSYEKTVTWGDQTWDEMMIGYFDMVEVIDPKEQNLQHLAQQFRTVGKTLAAKYPTLQRVCVSIVIGDRIKIVPAFHKDNAELSEDMEFSRKRFALAKFADDGQEVVFSEFPKKGYIDLYHLMSAGIRSSCHFPFTIQGVKGTINFWSVTPAAFTPELIQQLRQEVKEMSQAIKN